MIKQGDSVGTIIDVMGVSEQDIENAQQEAKNNQIIIQARKALKKVVNTTKSQPTVNERLSAIEKTLANIQNMINDK